MKLVKTITTLFALSVIATSAQAITLVEIEPVEKVELVELAKVNLAESMLASSNELFATEAKVEVAVNVEESEETQTASIATYAE